MVQDVYNRADVLNTTKSHGAPNFRKVQGNYPLFGMGQPSLNGFKQVLQRLQIDGCEVSEFSLSLSSRMKGSEALSMNTDHFGPKRTVFMKSASKSLGSHSFFSSVRTIRYVRYYVM